MRKLALISSMSALLLVPALAQAQTHDEYGGSAYGGAMYGQPVAPGQTKIKEEYKPEIKTEVNVAPEATVTPIAEVPAPEVRHRAFLGGLALTVGGGVTDFTKTDARDITDPGGLWEARLGIGNKNMIGAEVAYVGTAQDINVLGLDNSAVLMSNSVEGVARLNIGNWAVQPFVFGGVGWANYDIVNEDFNTSSIAGNDNMLTVPVGGGLRTRISGFLVDGRFTYRPTFEDQLFNLSSLGNNSTVTMDTWQATLRLGYEF